MCMCVYIYIYIYICIDVHILSAHEAGGAWHPFHRRPVDGVIVELLLVSYNIIR